MAIRWSLHWQATSRSASGGWGSTHRYRAGQGPLPRGSTGVEAPRYPPDGATVPGKRELGRRVPPTTHSPSASPLAVGRSPQVDTVAPPGISGGQPVGHHCTQYGQRIPGYALGDRQPARNDEAVLPGSGRAALAEATEIIGIARYSTVSRTPTRGPSGPAAIRWKAGILGDTVQPRGIRDPHCPYTATLMLNTIGSVTDRAPPPSSTLCAAGETPLGQLQSIMIFAGIA